jgi:hypothetical protein
MPQVRVLTSSVDTNNMLLYWILDVHDADEDKREHGAS